MDLRVGLQSIADECGVSKSAVSLALRNSPRVSEARREEIKAAAMRLGYRPNPQIDTVMANLRARNLDGLRGVIGWLQSDLPHARIPDSFVARALSGARAQADIQGYGFDTIASQSFSSSQLTRMLRARGISGLIVAPQLRSPAHLNLDWSQFSAVTIGYSLARPDLPRIASDPYTSICLALKKVRQLGYRRVGVFIHQETDIRTNHLWRAGTLLHQNLFSKQIKIHLQVVKTSGEKLIVPWIRECKLDAIIAPENLYFKILENAGYALGENLGFASLDWSPQQSEISGTDQQPDLVGARAVDIVGGLMSAGRKAPGTLPFIVVVKGKWRDGTSLRSSN